MTWSRHLRIMAATLAGALAALYLFILAMNPYGNLPGLVLARHVIMDDNQRFQYPWIIRTRQYDSIVIGTSTSRLLAPRALEATFGGRFANLALNSGSAWEQWRIAELFLAEIGRPRTLVVGLDQVWCAADADTNRVTIRGFPEWMFDDNPWNDLAYMFNTRALEIAGRRLGHALGLNKARWPDDGYEVFTPPEAAWDLAKVRLKIYGEGTPRLPVPRHPAYAATEAERAAWRFPALDWLEALVRPGRWHKVLLVFPPVHVIAQPAPGSIEAAREAECKTRVAGIAARHGWPLLDFRIGSEITRHDVNYWDPLHYRVPIAERVTTGIARALATRRDDPGGDWKVVVGAGRGE